MFNTEYMMVEMIEKDHVCVCGNGKNEMDGPCTRTQSNAGSNTFAGVLEVVELGVEMVEQSMECEGSCRLGGKSKRCWCCIMLTVPEVLMTNLHIARRSDHHSSAM